MRSSNLSVIANAMETEAKAESSYKQMQRFLKRFRWRRSGFEAFQLELLSISGKVDLIIDRTEWKFGRVWINLLMVSVYYRGVAIPIGWKVFSRKGNLSGRIHVLLLREAIKRIERSRVAKLFAEREFCNQAVFAYLYKEEIDFCIRLKKSYLADGTAFKELLVRLAPRVKIKAKKKFSVLGYQMGVSCVRLSESEYLIVATREVEPQAFAEYEKRWGIETLFGNLKSRGFDFEETHLTKRSRIERLMFLFLLISSL